MSVEKQPSLWGLRGFPGGTVVKNLPANAGDTKDMGSIPGSGRSPGARNGNVLQYSCLENSMDRGAWWATVHGVAKSWTQMCIQTLKEFKANHILLIYDNVLSLKKKKENVKDKRI